MNFFTLIRLNQDRSTVDDQFPQKLISECIVASAMPMKTCAGFERMAVYGIYHRFLTIIFFLTLAFAYNPICEGQAPRYRLKWAADVYYSLPQGHSVSITIGSIVIPETTFRQPRVFGDETYVWVSVPGADSFGSPLMGWMRKDDLEGIRADVETKYLRVQFDNEDPAVVFFPDGAELKKTAEEMVVVQSNKPENQRLPEPYFTLAVAYRLEGNHAFALKNYLEGLKYVKNEYERNPHAYVLYEQYFQEVHRIVDETLRQPVSVVAMGRNEADTAGRHFSQGFNAFWEGEQESKKVIRDVHYRRALTNFTNAVKVNWKIPAYWYYVGLAHWRLGDKEGATFAFLFASQMEKNAVERDGNYRIQRQTSEFLTRLQGKDREFIEKIRWGDPSNLVLNDFFNE